MKTRILTVFLASLLLYACAKKEDSNPDPEPPVLKCLENDISDQNLKSLMVGKWNFDSTILLSYYEHNPSGPPYSWQAFLPTPGAGYTEMEFTSNCQLYFSEANNPNPLRLGTFSNVATKSFDLNFFGGISQDSLIRVDKCDIYHLTPTKFKWSIKTKQPDNTGVWVNETQYVLIK